MSQPTFVALLTLILLANLPSITSLPIDSDNVPPPEGATSPNTLLDPPSTKPLAKSGWNSLTRKWKERIFVFSVLGFLALSVGIFFLARWIIRRRPAKKAAAFEKLADEEREVVVVKAPREDEEMGQGKEEEEKGLIEKETFGEVGMVGVTRPTPYRAESWASQHSAEEKGKEVVRPGVERERSWSFEKGKVGRGVETAYMGGSRW